MRNCGQRNVRKHKEIKGSDKCVTLNMYEIVNILEKFDDLDKMETISSKSKVKMEGSRKWLVTALDLKTKARSKKGKKARNAIRNVSMKDLFKKIKEFEKIVKVPYLRRTLKHEPTSSYFHLVECIRECMMRCGENNYDVHNGYKKKRWTSTTTPRT